MSPAPPLPRGFAVHIDYHFVVFGAVVRQFLSSKSIGFLSNPCKGDFAMKKKIIHF